MTELAGQKIPFHRQLPDLRVQLLDLVLGVVVSCGPALEQPLGTAHQPGPDR